MRKDEPENPIRPFFHAMTYGECNMQQGRLRHGLLLRRNRRKVRLLPERSRNDDEQNKQNQDYTCRRVASIHTGHANSS